MLHLGPSHTQPRSITFCDADPDWAMVSGPWKQKYEAESEAKTEADLLVPLALSEKPSTRQCPLPLKPKHSVQTAENGMTRFTHSPVSMGLDDSPAPSRLPDDGTGDAYPAQPVIQ